MVLLEEVIIIRVSNPNSGFMKQLERMRALEFDENASLKFPYKNIGIYIQVVIQF